MEPLGNGLILILNGLLTIASWLGSWTTLLALAVGLSFAYLAYLEGVELDRSTAKPDIGMH